MTTLFISDLHLDAGRPMVTRHFLSFLDRAALSSRRLFVLGDLFEAWLGDDDPEPHHREVIEALRRYTHGSDRQGFFVRGNRDFLIGDRFCRETGMKLLEPQTVIDLAGRKALIMHGDELCTDDMEYQRYRRIVRHPAFKLIADLLPLSVRRRVAGKLRSESQAKSPRKPAAITDVNQRSVEQVMKEHRIELLIHGHTHRPGIHEFQLQGATGTRIVLGDWYTQGSVLESDDSGSLRLRTLAFDSGTPDAQANVAPADSGRQASNSSTD